MFDASWSITIEQVLLAVSLLLLMGVFSSKVSDRFAIPVLLLFLAIGMLAGSEGPGKIYFDNAPLAKSIGIIALIFIIFHGGLDTDWEEVRPVLWHAALLSTIGVLTASSRDFACSSTGSRSGGHASRVHLFFHGCGGGFSILRSASASNSR